MSDSDVPCAGATGPQSVSPQSVGRSGPGSVALVTGGARNIGRAIALELAQAGCHVVVNAVSDATAAESVADEVRALGVQSLVHMADVGNEALVQGLIDAALDQFGRIDCLVHNAAVRRQKPVTDITWDDWREVLSVALDAPFLLARTVAPHMMEAGGGRMVFLGGTPSHLGTRGRAHVCAGKMGAVGLMRVLANELGEHGITVNVVAPGHIDTERGASAGAISTVTRTRPLERKGTPEEIASTVGFLCSEGGGYITGQTIHVNGGMYFAGG